MTAQITDSFIYNGESYDLIGIKGEKLFTPADFGMQPTMLHTACYRGFYCAYEITADGIFLKHFTLREANDQYMPIEGKMPELEKYQATYKDLHVLSPFTGKIRLAKDFIRELYIHMGYQKATAYETVLDLTFEKGLLMHVLDRSDEVKKKRGAFKEKYGRQNILESIDEAFSLDMDLE